MTPEQLQRLAKCWPKDAHHIARMGRHFADDCLIFDGRERGYYVLNPVADDAYNAAARTIIGLELIRHHTAKTLIDPISTEAVVNLALAIWEHP